MTRLARLSALYAALAIVAGLLIGGGYYFYYRPMFPPAEKQAAIERFIKDPGSPVEQIRKVALESHDVVVAGFKAMDAAILMIVIVCLITAVGFASIAMAVRKTKMDTPGAL
jgi:hypothetical protein